MKKLILSALIMIAATMTAMAQNGFTLEQSVIASGGVTTAVPSSPPAPNNNFAVTSTVGQAVASGASSNTPFMVESGFLYAAAFAPTASMVTVSGTVKTAEGLGIIRAKVLITDGSGQTRYVMTGKGGMFQFTDVAAGDTYIFTVASKKYTFAQPIVTRTVFEHLTDVDFIADPFNGTK